MKSCNRSFMIAIPLMLALMLSALAVRPALADDNPPPPSDAPAEAAPAAKGPAPDVSQEATLAGASRHGAVDDSVRSVPLAHQQAVEIAVTGDPVWCPNGVAPRDHKGGCSHFEASLEALVNNWLPTGNGTIWVAHGPALAWLVINGTPGQSWAAAKNFSLTIQGGWNGNSGSMGLSAASPSDPYPLSTFSGVHGDIMVIWNWVGSLTLRNVTFNSATYTQPYDYSTLSLQTAGNITLDKVQVNNANNSNVTFKGYGALLDTRPGGGNVKVTEAGPLALALGGVAGPGPYRILTPTANPIQIRVRSLSQIWIVGAATDGVILTVKKG